MTVDNAVLENNDTITEGDDNDTDFDSGFNTLTETPEVKQTTEQVVDQPLDEPQQTVEYAQIPKADYERLLASAALIDDVKSTQDKAFGKIGGVERTLSELQARLADTTPLGEPIQASEEDFAELAEEFGADIASMQITGLNRILNKMGRGTGAPINQDQISELVAQQINDSTDAIVTQVEQRTEMRILSRKHPDWQTVGSTPEFVEWVGKLPETERAKVLKANADYDSVVLGDTFDKYKKSLEKANTGKPNIMQDAFSENADSTAPDKSTSDEDDDFNAGFNQK